MGAKFWGKESMAIDELLRVVAPPTSPVQTGDLAKWEQVEQALGTRLPTDYRHLLLRYGSGYFGYAGPLTVWNPLASHYLRWVTDFCEFLRLQRGLLGR